MIIIDVIIDQNALSWALKQQEEVISVIKHLC